MGRAHSRSAVADWLMRRDHALLLPFQQTISPAGHFVGKTAGLAWKGGANC
jgi:hypothetical protein